MEQERWENRGNSRLTNMVLGQKDHATSINEYDLIPNVYTLQFGLLQTGDRTSISVPCAEAIVNWSVKGQQQRRIITIASGVAISGVCDAVSVKIRDVSVTTEGADAIAYAVQTTLTKGVRPSTGQPPSLTTGPNQIVAGGVSPPGKLFVVPVNAGVMSFFVLACGDSGAVLTTTDIVAQVIGSNGILLAAYYPLITGGWIPLPAGAYAVGISSNASESVNADVNVIWGIEG
jgi:hypothetical protein